MTLSGLQIFMSLMDFGVPTLGYEKSQWVVMTPSGLQVLMPLVGIQVPKLDPERSQ